MKNFIRKTSRIFYIYTEASAAVFFALCAGLEFALSFFVGLGFQPFARYSSLFFAAVAVACAAYITYQERK